MTGIVSSCYLFSISNKSWTKKESLKSFRIEMKTKEFSKIERFSVVMQTICEYLASNDLNSVSQVNYKWRIEALSLKEKILRQYVQENAFGAIQWNRYFGNVEKKRLNLAMWDILNSKDPFDPEKLIKDTYMLYLLPKNVNGEPFTLNSFQNMIQKQNTNSKGHIAKFGFMNQDVLKKFGNNPNSASCWVLLRKGVIPTSRKKSFDEQCQMSNSIPKVLDVVVGILTHCVSTGKKEFSNNPSITFTRCEEMTQEGRHIVVGGFGDGLIIDDGTDKNSEIFGLADVRRFPV